MYSYYRTASVSQTTISYYFSNRTNARRSRNPQPGTVYTVSILDRNWLFPPIETYTDKWELLSRPHTAG